MAKETKSEVVPVVEAPALPPGTVTEASMQQMRLSTKEVLDRMPKVQVRLRKPEKDAPNFETVQINGHTYQIMRGVDVEVPQLVKDILVEAELI